MQSCIYYKITVKCNKSFTELSADPGKKDNLKVWKQKWLKYLPILRGVLAASFICLTGLFYTAACAGCAEKDQTDEVRIEEQSVMPAESSAQETQTVRTAVVYVCGEVNAEGVYTMPAGSRVADAIEAAGGAKEDADLKQLNLAETVADSQKILVPAVSETSDMSDDSKAGDGLVNINQADKAALMTLPGIGEAKAAAIVQYRSEHGAFSAAEDIMNVPGIKQSGYDKIKDRIKV